ncbi:hypothetical protein E4U41_000298 [Claviceps citrina]|nr:hypothetical protein E4U41_000298 [Claviceps citrina]
MPVPFAVVCDLLDECHKLHVANKPNSQTVSQWFIQHRTCIDAQDTDLAALLSTLLPEKRSDRVYCIKTPTLEKLIGKALMLGASRLVELGLYRRPGQGVDLADCVERILTATPNPLYSERDQVTVEEIDQVLHGLASRIVWSSPSIRACQPTSTAPSGRHDLQGIYRRLCAREAKWFTRLVLKEYKPLILDSTLIYRCCDPALPLVLRIQEDFATAIKTLQTLRAASSTGPARHPAHLKEGLATVKPKLGVKVGRQDWFKGRSIKHCLDMGHGRMSVEDKIDGEYCQIHVSIAKGKLQIQIFSKSGKDSTEDRHKLNGRSDLAAQIALYAMGAFSKESSSCMMTWWVVSKLAKLPVFARGADTTPAQENKIMPFHRIRNHVARRGRLIDVDLDSRPRSYENLMIVYYDILFLDQQSLLNVRHSERFQMLEKTIHCERGRACLVNRTLVDFDRPTGASELRKAFARVITAKGEGLVLKPDEPYFDLSNRRPAFSPGFCIKLKKEYIGTFGDVGDFAVVGAGFNPAKARSYKIANLAWTVFYVGCLNNREEVRRWGATPDFTVVCAVQVAESLLRTLVAHGRPEPTPLDGNTATRLRVPRGVEADDAPLQVAFRNPPVFDMRCFSFDKPGNTGFWTLRFPTVTKIHFDRDFSDAVTFEELQAMAREARAAPDLEDSQENLGWIAKLEGADPRGRAVDALSQLTATTMPTPSPRRSRTPHSPAPRRRSGSREPSRDRSASQRSVNMSPRAPLTPPTSSPTTSPSLKRHAPTLSCGSSPAATRTKRRKPLQDVDGNASASQNPTTTRTLFAGTAHDEDGLPHSTRPVTEEKPEDVSPAAGKAAPAKQASRECAFAGKNCHLFGSTVLLAGSALAESPEREALLEAHGAAGAVADMDEWLGENRFGAALGSRSRSVLILVDTVQREGETEKVLASVELARGKLRRKTRGWIAVYDWRVLEHLKVMEDKDAKQKYYDGFQDPWRRWYCGIV